MKSYKTYRESKQSQLLVFALSAFFIGFAIIFLALEKIFLSKLVFNQFLGLALFGPIALLLSGGVVLTIDIFSFRMAFPTKARILSIISAVIIAIYLSFWIFDPTRDLTCDAGVCEITFGNNFTPRLSYFTIVPLIVIAALVFFYYAIKIREYSTTKSNRSWLLGLGVITLMVAYSVEIVGLAPTITMVIRTFWFVGAMIFYWALFKIKGEE